MSKCASTLKRLPTAITSRRTIWRPHSDVFNVRNGSPTSYLQKKPRISGSCCRTAQVKTEPHSFRADGADPAQDKVKTLWCEKVNIFFDGLPKSGVAIGTPVDPRMKTGADLRKNKALPTPRDKGAASAAWQKQFTSQGSRNLKWKRKADKALERRKKYETAKISKLEARIEALKGKVAQRN